MPKLPTDADRAKMAEEAAALADRYERGDRVKVKNPYTQVFEQGTVKETIRDGCVVAIDGGVETRVSNSRIRRAIA